jgi:hypothetical protein
MVKGAVVVRRLRRAPPDPLTRALEALEPTTHAGVTVALVPPDSTRPVLAACRACRRPIVYGALAPGSWITVMCRHCRLVHRVSVEPE